MKVTELPVERHRLGLFQRDTFRHADRHDEEIEEVDERDPFLIGIQNKLTHSLVFSILILGDQNAGKTSLLSTFVADDSPGFLRLLSFLPFFQSYFLNFRFLSSRNGETDAQWVARGRDEGCFLDTDVGRAMITMTKDDFLFFVNEFRLHILDGSVNPESLSAEFSSMPSAIENNLAEEFAVGLKDVCFVSLLWREFGGDHLDRMMTLTDNGRLGEGVSDHQKRHGTVAEDRQDANLREVITNSRAILQECSRLVYVIDGREFYRSFNRNLITSVSINPKKLKEFRDRIEYIESTRGQTHGVLMVLISRLPPLHPGEELDLNLCCQTILEVFPEFSKSDIMKISSTITEATSDTRINEMIMRVIKTEYDDEAAGFLTRRWKAELQNRKYIFLKNLLFMLFSDSRALGHVGLFGVYPMGSVGSKFSTEEIRADITPDQHTVLRVASVMRIVSLITALELSENKKTVGVSGFNTTASESSKGLDDSNQDLNSIRSMLVGLLNMQTEHLRYFAEESAQNDGTENEVSVNAWTDFVEFSEYFLSETHLPQENLVRRDTPVARLSALSLPLSAYKPHFNAVLRQLESRGFGLTGISLRNTAVTYPARSVMSAFAKLSVQQTGYLTRALSSLEVPVAVQLLKGDVLKFNIKLSAKEYPTDQLLAWKVPEDCFLFDAMSQELIRLLGPSWLMRSRFWSSVPIPCTPTQEGSILFPQSSSIEFFDTKRFDKQASLFGTRKTSEDLITSKRGRISVDLTRESKHQWRHFHSKSGLNSAMNAPEPHFVLDVCELDDKHLQWIQHLSTAFSGAMDKETVKILDSAFQKLGKWESQIPENRAIENITTLKAIAATTGLTDSEAEKVAFFTSLCVVLVQDVICVNNFGRWLMAGQRLQTPPHLRPSRHMTVEVPMNFNEQWVVPVNVKLIKN